MSLQRLQDELVRERAERSAELGLAAVGTAGAGLVVVSCDSNNMVTSFDLGARIWSCHWSPATPHQIYAGLATGQVWCASDIAI